MAPDTPPELQACGKVADKPALLRLDEEGFSWSDETHDGLAITWSTIPLKHLIAAEPSTLPSSDVYTLLYVTENVSKDEDAIQSPWLFKTLQISGLPRALLSGLLCSNTSIWRRRRESEPARTIHVVVSTGSGTGLASAVWNQLIKPLLSYLDYNDQDYTVHSTTSATSVTELIENVVFPAANRGRTQSLLLLSGDGGLVDVVNALLDGERTLDFHIPAVTLVPLGTGNAMANSAVIADNDSTMGLRTMLLGSSKEIPLFHATFSPGARLLVNEGRENRRLSEKDGSPVTYGAVVLSWGVHAALVADSDTAEYRKFGAERFKMAGKEALFPSDGSMPHAYLGRVSVLRSGTHDWEALPSKEHGYVLATLVSSLEAGFTISPASQPLDGKLMLIHFGHLDGEAAMEIMTKAYQGGTHVEDDRVRYEEVEGLRIGFDEEDGRWRRVCVDGKIIRVEQGGWVELKKQVEGVVDLVCRDEEKSVFSSA